MELKPATARLVKSLGIFSIYENGPTCKALEFYNRPDVREFVTPVDFFSIFLRWLVP